MEQKKRCCVIRNYTSAHPNPLVLSAGETIAIEDRESEWPGWVWSIHRSGVAGWIPERILKQEGSIGHVTEDYDATELTVRVGTELTFSHVESGWLWCTTPEGKQGWVPLENVEMIESDLSSQ